MTENLAGKVPVVAVVREAWIFLGRNWRMFVPAALATAVIAQIGQAATLLMGGGGVALLVLAPMILGGLMFSGAVLRKAVRDEFVAPVGVTLSGDEGRLLGVGVSVTLLAIPFFLILMVVLSATVFRSLASSPEALEAMAADPEAMMQAMFEAMGVGGVAVLTAILVVVSAIFMGLVALANAATMGEKRIMLFQAWSWMKGNVFRVLSVFLLTAIPVLVISTLVTEVFTTLVVSASGGTITLLPYLLVLVATTFVSALISMPVAAMGAVLYKGLRPPELAK